jgi:hypothetical protein
MRVAEALRRKILRRKVPDGMNSVVFAKTAASPSRADPELKVLMRDRTVAETEGFEPSIGLYNPITV